MTKNIKFMALSIVIAITGLSLENALTGHGIKGNKNLNPDVLATGSNSGSNDEGTNLGTTVWWINPVPYHMVTTTKKEGNKTCTTTITTSTRYCILGGPSECEPGTIETTHTECFTPANP
jgi:hypothetical protein